MLRWKGYNSSPSPVCANLNTFQNELERQDNRECGQILKQTFAVAYLQRRRGLYRTEQP